MNLSDVYLEEIEVRLKQRTTDKAIAKRERQAKARRMVKKDNITPRQKLVSLRGTKEHLEESSEND
jgi:hypothetical protein